ncbi:MAG TPA: undecaprenyl-diphosphate phosphatase [Rhodothermales bacterium]|nr:undecaprenyl-diphosphate phosphatase [Rhodothermales bacterium]
MDLYLFLKVVAMGIVEGATEFIPVSSTGHLIIVGDWLGYTGEQAKVFEVFIQLGAILAIVWLYRQKLWDVVVTWTRDRSSRRFLVNLFIAFLPAAIVGLLTHDLITKYLFNPITVAAALVVGGIAILIIEAAVKRTSIDGVDEVPYGTALGIGLAQVLALFPGVSRSGATIMGAYSLGLTRKAATEFSFFLAIPVMFAATLFDLVKSRDVLSAGDVPAFAIGFVVAFISALVVVKAFVSFVSHNSFTPFAWYRIVFGLALFLFYTL